jgi:hypothetical protein
MEYSNQEAALRTEPLEEGDADNSSSFADYSNRSKLGSMGTLPEGLANTIAEIARDCIITLANKINILEAALVQRLSEAALCVQKAIAALAYKRSPDVVSEKKNKKDKNLSI